MKIFITGASGYLGNKLAHTLAGMDNEVHALVRSATAEQLLQHPNITVFKGDILQKESLMTAMKGCKQVYHTAAKVGVWAKYPSVFYEVNVEGTRNVLDAALESGVEKIVFTSSCGVIGPTHDKPLRETDVRTVPAMNVGSVDTCSMTASSVLVSHSLFCSMLVFTLSCTW